MGPPPDDHSCGWKTRATDLEAKLDETAAKLEEVVAKMAAMERRILGPKSEKLPPMDREVRKERPADPAATQATRRKNAELRATRVVSEAVPHKVPDSERTCSKCNSADLRPVGDGKGLRGAGLRTGILPPAAAHPGDSGLHLRRAHRDGARP